MCRASGDGHVSGVAEHRAACGDLLGESQERLRLRGLRVGVDDRLAGVRTLEELLKVAPDLYDITVFGAEPHANYNRILLSPVLAGEMTIKDIMLNDVDWYAQNRITLTQQQMKYAGIQGEVTFVGDGKRVRLWQPQRYTNEIETLTPEDKARHEHWF